MIKKLFSRAKDQSNYLFVSLLAAKDPLEDIFGKPSIDVPAGLNPDAQGGVGNTIGHLIGVGIRIFILFAGLTLMVMLLWGAYDYITSNGDDKHVQNAQKKMTAAVIGILLVILALSLFQLIAGNILGIVGPGFTFRLPTL